jgi:hypothetical protein
MIDMNTEMRNKERIFGTPPNGKYWRTHQFLGLLNQLCEMGIALCINRQSAIKITLVHDFIAKIVMSQASSVISEEILIGADRLLRTPINDVRCLYLDFSPLLDSREHKYNWRRSISGDRLKSVEFCSSGTPWIHKKRLVVFAKQDKFTWEKICVNIKKEFVPIFGDLDVLFSTNYCVGPSNYSKIMTGNIMDTVTDGATYFASHYLNSDYIPEAFDKTGIQVGTEKYISSKQFEQAVIQELLPLRRTLSN